MVIVENLLNGGDVRTGKYLSEVFLLTERRRSERKCFPSDQANEISNEFIIWFLVDFLFHV